MPPKIVPPLMAFRPPVPNTPLELISSVWLVLLSVPVRLTVPPVRVKLPSVGVEMLPPKLSMPPETVSLPVLVPLAPVRLKVPPTTSKRPLGPWLLQVAEDRVRVPLVERSVPVLVLVKTLEVMLKDWPAVLPMRVPELTTVAALFWAMPP